MSDALELQVDSTTGVDVVLPVAGPGGRCLAFVIDWHLRLSVALFWYCAAAPVHSLATRGTLSLRAPFDPGASWYLLVALPSAAIYLLYHPLLELLMRGRTPGKRMAGLRILASDGSAPSNGALLIRNAFRLVDSLPGVYCVGLVATLMTRQHRRIGDLAAGTLLVYDRTAPAAVASAGARNWASIEAAQIAAELDARWDTLSPAARRELASRLLGRAAALHGDARNASQLTATADEDALLRGRLQAAIAGKVP